MELTIKDYLIKKFISHFITKLIKEKTNLDIKIDIKDIEIRTKGDMINFTLSANGETETKNLTKLIKGV